jgi:exodeoxyribonuclease VIII
MLSYSSLKAFLKSPNHYLLYKQGIEPTEAMKKGSAADCLILTPERFKDEYYILDDTQKVLELSDYKNPRATKVYKEWLSKEKERAQERTILTLEEYDSLTKIKAAVWAQTNILEGTERQVELTGEIARIPFRGFADAIGDAVIDLKTTVNSSPDFFQRQSYNLQYHLQAAVYLELTGKSDYFIIAVEKEAPYNCQVYALSKDAIQAGRELMYYGIQKFKEWNGEPEGYSANVEILDLPKWAKY